jgi:hypothetical protein
MNIRPDPTFHASPKLAMEAPPESFAYTVLLSPDASKPDALAVIDVKPGSSTYGQVVHTVTMPNKGDEFHHFGWNACSSSLSPLTGHAFLERRYLIIPGMRSSRIYIVDTKPDPTKAAIHKIIEPEEIFRKTGYSRPHTVHCGPEGIYVSTLGGGGKNGTDGPPGVFIMDCETFEVLGRWELDRGPQTLHYDFWWNLPRDYMVTSEWALPPQFENGIVPEDLLSNKYGHRIHFWDLRARRNVQTIDLGANHQMALEVRPAHDPVREYGFLGVVVDTTNLEGGARAASFTSKRRRRSRPSPRRRSNCRRCCRVLAPCRRWYLISTCRWTTNFSTSPAGAPARCASTMSESRESQNLPARYALAESHAAHRTRMARPLEAARRWSRSAATASGCTGPTRCIRHGTTSSIPMVFPAPW